MSKSFFLIFISVLFLSCKGEKKIETLKRTTQSEMAVLMLKMFDENAKVKSQILKGEELAEFPQEFLNIHSATLTDPSDRSEKFNAFSKLYLSNQKALFETHKDSLKRIYNQTINTCIACHQSTCPGPIPRIKKLLIK